MVLSVLLLLQICFCFVIRETLLFLSDAIDAFNSTSGYLDDYPNIDNPYCDQKVIKDICGYFQCAPFPRLQTGKVVWVLSFDP